MKPGTLTEQELSAYRERGYIVPSYRLSPAELARLSAQTQAVIAANPHLANRPIPNPHCAAFQRHGVNTDGALMEFAAKREILDIVEQISGTDLILWSWPIFHKPPSIGKR